MGPLDNGLLRALREHAEHARASHYGSYSGCLVLASVETVDGDIYSGSNVEIANYSLTKHAEEAAILAAIADRGKPGSEAWLRTLYVAGLPPCGSCRQFAAEFAIDDAICVIDSVGRTALKRKGVLNRRKRKPEVRRLDVLLPNPPRPGEVAS